MYVCLCRGVTEKQLVRAISSGVNSLPALKQELGVGVDCGSCCEYLQARLDDAAAEPDRISNLPDAGSVCSR